MLGDLWADVDLAVPYSKGELLARVRERGTVTFEYRDEDVRIIGKVPPSIAGELQSADRAWARARKMRKIESPDDSQRRRRTTDMTDELLTAGKIAEKLGVSAGQGEQSHQGQRGGARPEEGQLRVFRGGEGGSAGGAGY